MNGQNIEKIQCCRESHAGQEMSKTDWGLVSPVVACLTANQRVLGLIPVSDWVIFALGPMHRGPGLELTSPPEDIQNTHLGLQSCSKISLLICLSQRLSQEHISSDLQTLSNLKVFWSLFLKQTSGLGKLLPIYIMKKYSGNSPKGHLDFKSFLFIP